MKCRVIYKPCKNLGTQKPYPIPSARWMHGHSPFSQQSPLAVTASSPTFRATCAANFGTQPFSQWCVSQTCVCQLYLSL